METIYQNVRISVKIWPPFSSYSAFEQKLLENDFASFIVNHPVLRQIATRFLEMCISKTLILYNNDHPHCE